MKKKILAIFFALILALPAFGASAASNLAQDKAKESIVRFLASDTFLFEVEGKDGIIEGTSTSTGSGVQVGTGKNGEAYFITNRHVVEGVNPYYWKLHLQSQGLTLADFANEPNSLCDSYLNDSIWVLYQDVSTKIPVEVVAVSSRTDLALVKTKGAVPGRKPITIRPYEFQGSEDAYALGFPGISDDFDLSTVVLPSGIDDITVTKGVVSKFLTHSQTQKGDQIQINVDITHGNSGGALVDSKGQLIGINTHGLNNGDMSANFAIASSEIIRMLEDEKYITYHTAGGFNFWPLIIGIAVAVAAVALIIVLVYLKRNNGKASNGGAYYLTAVSGSLKGKAFKLISKQALGRNGRKCQIVFPENTSKVSGRHCTVYVQGGKAMVKDENSSCGTFINGNRITAGEKCPLPRGSKLALGSENEAFVLDTAPVPVAKQEAARVSASGASRHLVFEAGALMGKKVELKDSLKLGRDPNACQIVFPKQTPKVSGIHCSFRFDGSKVYLKDEGSTYGTFVDGNRIEAGQEIVLHRGHPVSIGSDQQIVTLHS